MCNAACDKRYIILCPTVSLCIIKLAKDYVFQSKGLSSSISKPSAEWIRQELPQSLNHCQLYLKGNTTCHTSLTFLVVKEYDLHTGPASIWAASSTEMVYTDFVNWIEIEEKAKDLRSKCSSSRLWSYYSQQRPFILHAMVQTKVSKMRI